MKMPLSHLFARPAGPLTTPADGLTITAVIALYDDAPYVDRCFQGMAEQGVQAIVIDNDTLPATREGIARWYKAGVVREIHHLPRSGVMDWSGLLAAKERIINTTDSDWFILWDSDELREPPEGFATLREAFAAAGAAGFDTVNFDEFCFVPVTSDEDHAGGDYAETLQSYYFFQPLRYQRLNAFRRPKGGVALMEGAGHRVQFPGQRIWTEDCAMRHYLYLSEAHGRSKYGARQFSSRDLDRGWQLERAATTQDNFCLPDPEQLFQKRPGQPWNRSHPFMRHPSFVYDAEHSRAP